MSEIKLLPCPFCGGEAERTYMDFMPAVRCKRCKATVYREYLKQEDGAEFLLWNTRKPTVEAVPVVHGYWVGTWGDGYADGHIVFEEWECSECRYNITTEDPDVYVYCP